MIRPSIPLPQFLHPFPFSPNARPSKGHFLTLYHELLSFRYPRCDRPGKRGGFSRTSTTHHLRNHHDSAPSSLAISSTPLRCIHLTFRLCHHVHLGGTEELNVTSEPSGAKLVVDGAERGVAPMALKVERKQAHKVSYQRKATRSLSLP